MKRVNKYDILEEIIHNKYTGQRIHTENIKDSTKQIF